MFTIVVYEKATNKIILDLPLIFDDPTHIRMIDALVHDNYGFRIFSDTTPVYGEDQDGDIVIKPDAFIINSNLLMGVNDDESTEGEEW